ncbi:MAG: hypothetical protein H0U76_23490 [Ktedonobacteraceae bacterium]|nr:hypothetical protein [Ktedonobacteraceae bacterium]
MRLVSHPKQLVYAQYIAYAMGIWNFLAVIWYGVHDLASYVISLQVYGVLALSLGGSFLWIVPAMKLGQFRSWARSLLLVLAVLGVLGAVVDGLMFVPNGTLAITWNVVYRIVSDIVGLVLCVLLFIFLRHPEVRRAFRSFREQP